jgi:hypothetical protein
MIADWLESEAERGQSGSQTWSSNFVVAFVLQKRGRHEQED